MVAAVIGIVFGTVFDMGPAETLVRPVLMVMVFLVFLAVDLDRFGNLFDDIRFTLSSVVLNFVWTPVLAFLIGNMFFPDSLDLRIGLLLLLVTPCTDWYLVFTGLSKGNVFLSSVLLPMNLVLQLVLLPVYLSLFFGESMGMGFMEVFFESMLAIAVPLLFAVVVRCIARYGSLSERVRNGFGNTDQVQLVLLSAAIFFIFSANSTVLLDNVGILVSLVLPLLVFFFTNYAVSVIVSVLNRFDKADTTSLIFTVLARNSPLVLAVVSSMFVDRPLVLLALVVGPLVELPILSIVASYRLRSVSR